jgi:hypothetical protein
MFMFAVVCLVVLAHLALGEDTATNCPTASPFDMVPDDEALNACLAANPLLLLTPDGLSNNSADGYVGYMLNSTGLLLVNGSTVTTFRHPLRAKIVAMAGLHVPMISSIGTILDVTLTYLNVDGGKAKLARVWSVGAAFCGKSASATNDNYRTANMMLPGFLFPSAPVWRCWDPWERYAANILIEHCDIHDSVCGCGVGLSGKNITVRNNWVHDNGYDPVHNPYDLGFPYADGINAAVCEGCVISSNSIADNTNMMITAGPGPYQQITDNVLVMQGAVTQNGINLWPTNSGQPPSYWHPQPWDYSHSIIFNNSLSVACAPSPSCPAAMYTGIVAGGLPWSPAAWAYSAGYVVENKISGANIGLVVEGVSYATVLLNTESNEFDGGSPNPFCPSQLLAYTVADANNSILQSGFSRVQFHQAPCSPTSAPLTLALDNAAVSSLVVNGVSFPTTVSLKCGERAAVSATFRNTGTSLWQDLPAPRFTGYSAKLFCCGDWSGLYEARMAVSGKASPGASASFLFDELQAPAAAGAYNLTVRMYNEFLAWFGEPTPTVLAIVSC